MPVPTRSSRRKVDEEEGLNEKHKHAVASGVVVNLNRVPKGPGGVGETWDVAVLVSNHQLELEFRDRQLPFRASTA
jgi:hypothetical protein